jgi:hypothetical protein
MVDKNNGSDNLSKGLLDRLNAFLLSSSFLVAAFVTLLTINTSTSYIKPETIQELILLVSILGCIIAIVYFSMNIWDSINDKKGHYLHIWIIPLLFAAFWIAAWSIYSCKICYFILFLIGALLFGICNTLFILCRNKRDKQKLDSENNAIQEYLNKL